MNMIHSEASPEELSDEVSDSEVSGTSSSSTTTTVEPSRLTWVLDEEGTLGSASLHLRDRGFSSEGLTVSKVAFDSSSNLRSCNRMSLP